MINISLNYILGFSTIVICLQCYERLQFFHLHIVIKKMLQFFGAFNKNNKKNPLFIVGLIDMLVGLFKKMKGKLYGG